MAYPTSVVAVGDLITAAQINQWVVMLADETLGSDDADFDFTSIPAHWSHLLLVVYARGATAATEVGLLLRFNNDSGSTYDRQRLKGAAATASADEALAGSSLRFGEMPAASAPADVFGGGLTLIPHYAGSADNKFLVALGGSKLGTATGETSILASHGQWRSNAAITRITLLPGSGNFLAGSRATLYGMGRI